jgi:hypothetical protein
MWYLEARGRDSDNCRHWRHLTGSRLDGLSVETTLGSRRQRAGRRHRAVGAILVNKSIGLTLRCWIELYER